MAAYRVYLMSWALSCLSLREHYDDVELYTDAEGYRILIEQMRLPYSHVHVVLDDFACLPFHWALAKIKTYSMQDAPFVHVDGVIYLPNPLKEEIFDTELVAQNREIGTIYYWHMMERILTHKNIRQQINAPEHFRLHTCVKKKWKKHFSAARFGRMEISL